jgi:hypothetical protein
MTIVATACANPPPAAVVDAGVDGASPDADTARCHLTAPPLPAPPGCPGHCLVEGGPGASPRALYAYTAPYSTTWNDTPIVAQIADVTDGYVVAVASWGLVNGGQGNTWGLVEVPRGGGAPIKVETWGTSWAGFLMSTAVGDDGYLYYATTLSPADPAAAPTTFHRLPRAAPGVAATTLGVAPISRWGAVVVETGGVLLASGDFGLVRLPASGGAVTSLAQGFISSFAVGDGAAFTPTATGAIARVPLDGSPPTALTAIADAGRVAFDGVHGRLEVAAAHAFATIAPDGSDPRVVFRSDVDQFGAITVDGSRTFVYEACPTLVPETPAGGLTRDVDSGTGATGVLEDEPGYPFVAGPTGLHHDATATTFYWLR